MIYPFFFSVKTVWLWLNILEILTQDSDNSFLEFWPIPAKRTSDTESGSEGCLAHTTELQKWIFPNKYNTIKLIR